MSTNELERKITFVWRIENFSVYKFMREPVSLESPRFTCHRYKKLWLSFYPESYSVTLQGRSYNCIPGNIPVFQFDYQLQVGNHMTEKKACIWNLSNVDIKIDFKAINMYHTYNDCLTVKLSIWSVDKLLSNISHCYAHGCLEIDKFHLSWNIEEFGLRVADALKIFTIPEIGDFKISLNVTNDNIYVTIVLLNNLNCTNKPFQCEIIVLGLEGRKWKSSPKLHVFKQADEAWKFPLLININDLMKEKFLFDRNSELSLFCNFGISTTNFISKIKCYQSDELGFSDQVSTLDVFGLNTDEYFSTPGFNQHDDKDLNNTVAAQDVAAVSSVDKKLATIIDNQCGNENSNIDLLCGDLQRMYMDRKMIDIVFQVGEKTLPAHKFVLVARSPVFMAMFEQDMFENRSGIIDVTDVDYNTLDSMLLFMYGGKLQDISYENVIKLLVASHKYEIVSLQNHCSTILRSMMAVDTICEIIVYSDMVENIVLKKSAVEYFKANAKCILESDEWRQLLEIDLKLATEVLTEYAMAK